MTSDRPIRPEIVDASFDDIDAMAASPLAWNQEYQQIGHGRFHGQLTQLVLSSLQLGQVTWSPGILQQGCAPPDTWVFGLPLTVEGTLHVRRRPAPPGALLAATSRDDIGFSATGRTEIMVAVLPTSSIDRWVQQRRGIDKFDVALPSPHWQAPVMEMGRRASALRGLLQTVMASRDDYVTGRALARVESQIFNAILDLIPSAEVIEPLHNRARIARAALDLFHERIDDPPSVSELCAAIGARERTLYLSCVEAFGRPPAQLLLELRLNAAHRALARPLEGASITKVAAQYGFIHFGRFAAMYYRQFGELPSVTLARSRGSA